MNKITIEIEKSFHEIPIPDKVLSYAYNYFLNGHPSEYVCKILEDHDKGDYLLVFFSGTPKADFSNRIITIGAIKHSNNSYSFHS